MQTREDMDKDLMRESQDNHDDPIRKDGCNRIVQEKEKETSGKRNQDAEELEGSANLEQKAYMRGIRLVAITTAIMVAVLLVALDVNIIATAVPQIASTFNSLHHIGWYGSAYLLAVMALQPTYGAVYTHFSLKWTLITALTVFGVGSITCATASSSNILIVSRSIQGMGGAGIVSGGLNIVADLAPQRKRPVYIALLSSVYALAGAAGPPVGGLFVDSKLTWRFGFWINLPLVAIACFILLAFYKERQKDKPKQTLRQKLKELRIVASLLLISTLVCLFFALQRGGVSDPWSSTNVWPFLLAFAVGLLAFMGLQVHQGEKAMIPLRIIGQRTVYSCCIFVAMFFMSSSTISYYLPFYFQATKGVTARQSGLYILPFVVTNTFVTFIAAGVISKFGFYLPFMWSGAAILTIGCGLLSTLFIKSPPSAWISFQLIASIGFGLGVQIPFTAIQVKIPAKDRPIANSLAIFFQSFGGALALSIDQNIFSVSLKQFLEKVPSVDAGRVINQGPDFVTIGLPSDQTLLIRASYGKALQTVMIVPIVASGVAFLGSLATEWGNVKVVERED